ncbi:MAG: hypothetical protein JWP03_63 [Phycisphaerales bacterium]|jgi:hypothetical protein|nr:hypothetical protein [Phycisphaerales bacterium]
MWAILSDHGHADGFTDHGPAYAPMRQLVASVSKRLYADALHAFNSLTTFCITSAANYTESDGHDEVVIRYSPEMGLFCVEYAEWVSPTSNPTHRIAARRSSIAQSDVLGVVDLYVLRLQITIRQKKS